MSEIKDDEQEFMPVTVDELLIWLDENTFAIRPRPGFDKEKAIYHQGQRDLVDMLMEWRNDNHGKPIQSAQGSADHTARPDA